MPERGAKSTGTEWAADWVERQREALRQAAAAEADSGHKVEGDAATASGASPKSFEELLKTWRDAWSDAAGMQRAASTHFTELLAKAPAIGPLREHAETWRAVAAAQAECRKLEQELRVVMMGVQNDALDLVQKRLRERQAGAQPIKDFRELHKLWVDCGERVFAEVAHSDSYCKLQAELGNAMTRLRAQQQKVIEHALKQYDLPTRSELNTVHRQLRDQKAQLREHKELLTRFMDRMKAPARERKPTPKKKAKRTSR